VTGESPLFRAPAGITLENLCAHPQAVELLARWYHQEWYDIEGLSLQALTEELAIRLVDPAQGTTYVAISGGSPVGCVSLDRNDLPGHEWRGPWLASLYVLPAWRRHGLGRVLIERVIEAAARAGEPALYLWTAGSTHRYEAAGFSTLEQTTYGSRPITVMSRALPHR
jgi:GNAT superfamily N-acetyltransferase